MFMRGLLALAGLGLTTVALAQATMAPPAGAPGATWEAGKNYFVIDPPQPTATPGKVEVLEVFSYGCPHCNEFQPIAENIKKALPAGAQMRYLPAEFGRASWTTFARAYYAAEALGILDKSHAAVFKAVYVDKSIDGMNPTLEQVAAVYQKAAGTTPQDVIDTANSFAVNTKLKRADAFIKATGVDGTPTFIINGKYRLDGRSAGSFQALQELIKFLVAKEGAK